MAANVRISSLLAASCAALALGACVHERSKTVGTVREGVLGPSAADDGALPGSAWSDRAFGRRSTRSDDRPARESTPVVAAAEETCAPSPPPRIVRSEAPAAHRPIPVGETLEDRARTKFLSSTTEITADRITLYVPRAYAAEVVRRGATVATLRRLTVRASQLTVVVRDGDPDVQLSARGGVSLRSDQPASVIEESGLRGLLLKNDGYTPLR